MWVNGGFAKLLPTSCSLIIVEMFRRLMCWLVGYASMLKWTSAARIKPRLSNHRYSVHNFLYPGCSSDVLHVRTEYLAIDPAHEHIVIACSSGIIETRFHVLE